MLNNPYVLLILTTLFWSGNFVLGKAVIGSIPPMTLAYIRWAEAFIFFLPFCWTKVRIEKKALKNSWKFFLILGATGIMGFNMCAYISVKYTTAINAALINSFSPVVIAVFSILFLKEDISFKQLIGIIFSSFGVISIITRGDFLKLISLTLNFGDLIMFLAVIFWGIYTVLLKKKEDIASQKNIFFASMLGGLIISFPIIIYENYITGINWIEKLTIMHYLSLIYFGIFPTILSYLFFNKAVLAIGPNQASIFLHLIIVFTAVLGIVFLNEKIILAHVFGGLFIILGVFLVTEKNT
jgi:drug/metabolite transporter (DMT)-like permease